MAAAVARGWRRAVDGGHRATPGRGESRRCRWVFSLRGRPRSRRALPSRSRGREHIWTHPLIKFPACAMLAGSRLVGSGLGHDATPRASKVPPPQGHVQARVCVTCPVASCAGCSQPLLLGRRVLRGVRGGAFRRSRGGHVLLSTGTERVSASPGPQPPPRPAGPSARHGRRRCFWARACCTAPA